MDVESTSSVKKNDNVTNFYNGTLLIDKVGFQLKVNNMYLKRYQFIEKIGKSHSGSHRVFEKKWPLTITDLNC